MNTNTYEAVNTDENGPVPVANISWKPFLRQTLVCSALWTFQFVCGLSVGSPTVFIPQIRREANNTNAITIEMASWISSAFSFSGFFFVIILSFLTSWFGRKPSFMISVINSLVAFVVLYYSSSATEIIVCMVMQGVLSACQMIVSAIIMTEYTSPKYRGIFLTGKCAIFFWGLFVANTVGTFFHWRKIALIGFLCSLYPLISLLLWPESPYWLASKGRFKECAKSHRWLKGYNMDSEKELRNLISIQRARLERNSRFKLSTKDRTIKLYNAIISKEFYKPTLISISTWLIYLCSGKIATAVYAIDIIKKITGNESTAYTGMLILDGISIFSMYVGCILSKFVKRRVMLLVSSSFAAFLLLSISLYVYLIELEAIDENTYISLGLLILYSIALSLGPIIMAISIYAEIIPLKSRHLANCVIAIVIKISQGVILKVSPIVIKTFGLHVLYLGFAVLLSFFIAIVYLYLPETKDKTLQEITEAMSSNPRKNNTSAVSEESVNLRERDY